MSTDVTYGLRASRPSLAGALGVARAAGFWLAIALPLAYLPLLVVGPPALADPGLLGAAVGANLLAIVVGHGHDPSIGRRRRD